MSRILVSGSLAYDHVMNYDGLFKNVILPSKLDHLSVAFTASKKTVNFGGCAGNIAYTLKLFGLNPLILAAVGSDFAAYDKWLKQCGIDTSALFRHSEVLTASATIITDQEQNQITIFYGGAMSFAPHVLSVRDHKYDGLDLAIIAPDDPQRMVRLAKECKEMNIPYIFDPSQALTNMTVPGLQEALSGAAILIGNEYEVELICKMLGTTKDHLPELVPTFIETYGAKGSSIVSPEGMFFVKAVQPGKIADPTGCGDAFRAGVLAGMQMKLGIEKACRIGALAATYSLEHESTQGHTFTVEAFKKRMEDDYGESF